MRYEQSRFPTEPQGNNIFIFSERIVMGATTTCLVMVGINCRTQTLILEKLTVLGVITSLPQEVIPITFFKDLKMTLLME